MTKRLISLAAVAMLAVGIVAAATASHVSTNIEPFGQVYEGWNLSSVHGSSGAVGMNTRDYWNSDYPNGGDLGCHAEVCAPGLSHVSQLNKWDSATQSWVITFRCSPGASQEFTLDYGMGLWVYVKAGTAPC